MKKLIFTIGREFGSQGGEIGKKLAEKLDIPYYDKELLARAAKDSGYCEEILESHDEKPTSSFLYSLVFDTYNASGMSTGGFMDMPLNHKIFLAQFDSIKAIAEEGPCVIVGRCADYALQDRDDVINIFIVAPEEERVKHVMTAHDMNEKKAKDMVIKQDKKRASYYNYYTTKRWGEAKSYNLVLDSSKLGVEGCVDMIIAFAEAVK